MTKTMTVVEDGDDDADNDDNLNDEHNCDDDEVRLFACLLFGEGYDFCLKP